jgi:hypothetical protein
MRCRRSVCVAVAFLCAPLVLTVTSARADPPPKPAPQQLWQAFPLDQTPRQQQPARPPVTRQPPAAKPQPHATPSTAGDSSRWHDLGLVALVIAAIVVLVSAAARFGGGLRKHLRSVRWWGRTRPRGRDTQAGDISNDLIEALRQVRLSQGASAPSTAEETEVLKAKLAETAANAASEADGSTSADDVDLLKAKLHTEPTAKLRAETTAKLDAETTAKLRAETTAKLRAEPTATKPEKATSPNVETLTAKLRAEGGATAKRAQAAREEPVKTRPVAEEAPYRARDPQPGAPSLLVIPEASAAPTPGPQAQPDERARRSEVSCSIRWWRGYVKSSFYAVAADDAETVIEESPFFRWRDAARSPDSDAAVAAHRALVAQLEREGWTPAGQGAQWFEVRLRRPGVPARPARAAAHRHDREEHHA